MELEDEENNILRQRIKELERLVQEARGQKRGAELYAAELESRIEKLAELNNTQDIQINEMIVKLEDAQAEVKKWQYDSEITRAMLTVLEKGGHPTSTDVIAEMNRKHTETISFLDQLDGSEN